MEDHFVHYDECRTISFYTDMNVEDNEIIDLAKIFKKEATLDLNIELIAWLNLCSKIKLKIP